MSQEENFKLSPRFRDSYRGALFSKTEKKTENSPDFTGDVEIAGCKFQICGWNNESKTGYPYIRLSVFAKEEDNAHLL